MSRTLSDYLGYDAHFDGELLSFYLSHLYVEIGGNPDFLNPDIDGDTVIAILLLALKQVTAQKVNERGYPIRDETTAIESSYFEPPKTFVRRNSEAQIKQTITFNLYLKANSTLEIGDVVGSEDTSLPVRGEEQF